MNDLRKAGYAAVDAKVDMLERRKLAEEARFAEKADRERVRLAEDLYEELYQEAMQEKV